jgi:hypothetical protein
LLDMFMIEQMKTKLKLENNLENNLVDLRSRYNEELELVNEKYRQLLVLSKYYESQLEKSKTEVVNLQNKHNKLLEELKESSRKLLGNKNAIIREKTEECEKLDNRVLELEAIVNGYEIV